MSTIFAEDMEDKSIQKVIRAGVAYQVAQAQGTLEESESVYSLPPCEFASAMQNADCILKYLDENNVVIKLPDGENLEGCCLARLERLVEE